MIIKTLIQIIFLAISLNAFEGSSGGGHVGQKVGPGVGGGGAGLYLACFNSPGGLGGTYLSRY
jgi:hypothetical protein